MRKASWHSVKHRTESEIAWAVVDRSINPAHLEAAFEAVGNGPCAVLGAVAAQVEVLEAALAKGLPAVFAGDGRGGVGAPHAPHHVLPAPAPRRMRSP